ncbi:MAG TPA: potassium channel family protein [Candidatus Limnocylindria bacterium]
MGFLRAWLRAFYDVAVDQTTHQLVTSVIILLTLGTVFYHFVEGWRIIDSLYFTVITLATVGYGDFAPKTDVGKLFTVLYVLAGVSVIIAFANTVLHRVASRTRRQEGEGLANTERIGVPDADSLDS